MEDEFDHIDSVNVAEPVFGIQVGKRGIRIHGPSKCEGRPCPFHNPSDHALKDALINVRMDRNALVERICEHGVGHPDPDSVAYFEQLGQTMVGIHGCDGCC